MDCRIQRLAESRILNICMGLVAPRYRNVLSVRLSDLICDTGDRTGDFVDLRKDSQLGSGFSWALQVKIHDLYSMFQRQKGRHR